MGQYYKIAIVDDNFNVIAARDAWSLDFGAKLMEHSYFNIFTQCAFEYIKSNPNSRLVWAGDYADEREGKEHNIYCHINDNTPELPIPSSRDDFKSCSLYVLNNDKKEAILYRNLATEEEERNWELCINPLPLLTCEGNGRGGGDYHRGTHMELVGSWCGDRLEVAEKVPEGYKTLDIRFREN